MSFFNGDILASSSDGIVLKDLGGEATTPDSGKGTIYVNGDSLYFKSDGGTATNLTSGGGVSLTGSTDNTICTVTGSNAIQGESNLLFDGSYLYSSYSTSGHGSGFTPGTYKVYINNIGGETITHIYFDLDGLYYSGTSDTIIGDSSASNAYFYQINPATNGQVYKVEFSSHKEPDSNVTENLGIFTSDSLLSTGADASNYSLHIIYSTTVDVGFRNVSGSGSSLNLGSNYLYLFSSSGTGGTFSGDNSGKLLIKLYGVKAT